MDNWKTIKTFTYSHDAHLMKSFLESENIPTELKGEYTAQVVNYLAFTGAGVELQVPEDLYEKAVEMLRKQGYEV
ncbi:MAG: DUF2007 domain-containing protein [Bacteroidales bacterium]|jgi:hypothetical protein|nr:DUF2007 domain-containing protein [Bacteroidales bacterium]